MTVGWPSNGPRASSIFALPAPAAQTSAGWTACSLLPWLAVLPPGNPSNHPHIMLFSGDVSLTPQPTSQRSYSPQRGHPLRWLRQALGGSLPGPRPRPPRLCSRRGEVNMVNKQQPSEEADSRGPHRKMPPYYTQKRMNTPADCHVPSLAMHLD